MADSPRIERTYRFTVFDRHYLEQGKEFKPGLGAGVFAWNDYRYDQSESTYASHLFQAALAKRAQDVLQGMFLVRAEPVDAGRVAGTAGTMESPRSVTLALFERYRSLCQAALASGEADLRPGDPQDTGLQHLVKLCTSALVLGGVSPVDKLSRWLGFVQGVLTMRGLVTVQEERDFSRPLFHAAYRNLGFDVPETVDVDQVGQGEAC